VYLSQFYDSMAEEGHTGGENHLQKHTLKGEIAICSCYKHLQNGFLNKVKTANVLKQKLFLHL